MDPKNELTLLKSKIDLISSQYETNFKDIEEREARLRKIGEKVNEILHSKGNYIVKLNVGGQIFMTRVSTLLSNSTNDTLFHELFSSFSNNSEEVFIDRSPVLFSFILDFLRTKNINTKRLRKEELFDEFRAEAEYYGITDIINQFGAKKNLGSVTEVKFTKVEVNRWYNNSTEYGSGPNDLMNKNLNRAFLTDSPGVITVHFDNEVEFEEMEVGGFTGDGDWVLANGWGCGAKILTSVDGNTWELVGILPTGFGERIIPATVKRSSARYLKLQHHTWMAIGYLNIKPL
jgi:hypothetical protein